MSLGTGIAIAGIWLAVAVSCFTPTGGFVAILAAMATAAVAMSASDIADSEEFTKRRS